MKEELLLDYYYEYKENGKKREFCFDASYLNTEDLCIWVENNYICMADKSVFVFKEDLDKRTGSDMPSLIYETSDVDEIADIRKALGIKDYDERLKSVYLITQGVSLKLAK